MEKFLPEDPKEAQKVFNSLPIKSQLDTVLGAHGKKRLHYLFLSERPEQLVQQLPELELFLTVKEVGEKDALDLISLTTPEQFQYLLDLDLWKKNDLDPKKVLHWMEILIECGEKKVAQFIRTSDPDLILLILKKLLYVTTLEGDPLEVRDRIPLFTLDQYYFIDFKGKGTREVLQPFLGILYHVDGSGYRRLMDSLIQEMESELEETELRLRKSRLADYGFPDFEEALEIYRFVNPDSLVLEEKAPPAASWAETEKTRPIFYLTFQSEGPFLSSILSRIDDPLVQDRLRVELAALCNKAMVAEPIDLSAPNEIERVVRKVFHYLNLGLQYLCKEDDAKALHILQAMSIQRLFQCGVGAILLLKRKAESILNGPWFSGSRENLILLDTIHGERFEGLLSRRPALYRDGKFEDFKNIQEIRETQHLLDLVQTVTETLGERFNISPGLLKKKELAQCYPEIWKELTLSTLFLTSFANQILTGAFQFEAIHKARLKDYLAHVFERNAQGKGVVKREIRTSLKNWVESIEGDEHRRQHLLTFFDFSFDLLEQEYGKIPPGEEIDPRYVKGLLVCE